MPLSHAETDTSGPTYDIEVLSRHMARVVGGMTLLANSFSFLGQANNSTTLGRRLDHRP